MKRIKVVTMVLLATIFVILVYFSPDESYWHKKNPEHAIDVGRRFAFDLLNGYQEGLLDLALEPARDTIQHTPFEQVSLSQISAALDGKEIHVDLLGPLYSDQTDDEMELVALEQLESFFVMTFAFKYYDRIVEIPGHGKLLFATAVRYYQPVDGHPIPKLLRKIANLPIVRTISGEAGTTGRWAVFDYFCNYDLADYFQWVLQDEESYTLKQYEENQDFTRKLSDSDSMYKFLEQAKLSADTSLALLYEWGNVTTRKQVDRLERLHRTIEGK